MHSRCRPGKHAFLQASAQSSWAHILLAEGPHEKVSKSLCSLSPHLSPGLHETGRDAFGKNSHVIPSHNSLAGSIPAFPRHQSEAPESPSAWIWDHWSHACTIQLYDSTYVMLWKSLWGQEMDLWLLGVGRRI